jgi:hypothetical protein
MTVDPPDKFNLFYDDEKHEYRLGSLVIPHVTGILERLGFYEHAKGTDVDLQYGKAVHKMVELYELGKLNEAMLDEGLRNPLSGWKHFRSLFPDLSIMVDSNGPFVERKMANRKKLYAGTIDFLFVRTIKPGGVWRPKYVIVDLKSSFADSKAHNLQTAAYEDLCRATSKELEKIRIERIVAKVAHDSDKCKVVAGAAHDENDWQSCLNVYRRLIARQ